MKLVKNAYAKINLGLDVIRRREDGYHEVKMVMQTVDLCDTLTFERREDEELHIYTDSDCRRDGGRQHRCRSRYACFKRNDGTALNKRKAYENRRKSRGGCALLHYGRNGSFRRNRGNTDSFNISAESASSGGKAGY